MSFLSKLKNIFSPKKPATSGSSLPTSGSAAPRKVPTGIEKQIEEIVADYFPNCSHLQYIDGDTYRWQSVFKALAFAESNFNVLERYEEDLGLDAVTGKQNTSEGLLQLSYQDAKYHGANFDWNADRSKSNFDPSKTIFDVKNNIQAGMIIMNKLVKQKGNYIFDAGNYWAVLKPSNKRHAVFLKRYNEYMAQKGSVIKETPVITPNPTVPKEEVKPQPEFKRMKIAFIEGHGDKSGKGIDTGSTHWNGMTELAYTRECTVLINLRKEEFKHEVKTFTQYPTVGEAAKSVIAWKPDASMEMHTNAYNKKAKGCQVNVLSNDPASFKLAKKFSDMFCKKFNRVLRDGDGVLETGRNERGVYNLAVVEALPASILLEPFFGDNKDEWISPDTYVTFLIEFVNSL